MFNDQKHNTVILITSIHTFTQRLHYLNNCDMIQDDAHQVITMILFLCQCSVNNSLQRRFLSRDVTQHFQDLEPTGQSVSSFHKNNNF